jgi:hypothetical protein
MKHTLHHQLSLKYVLFLNPLIFFYPASITIYLMHALTRSLTALFLSRASTFKLPFISDQKQLILQYLTPRKLK